MKKKNNKKNKIRIRNIVQTLVALNSAEPAGTINLHGGDFPLGVSAGETARHSGEREKGKKNNLRKFSCVDFAKVLRAIIQPPRQNTVDLCQAGAPLVGFQVGRWKRRWQIVHNRFPKVLADLRQETRRNTNPKDARVRRRAFGGCLFTIIHKIPARFLRRQVPKNAVRRAALRSDLLSVRNSERDWAALRVSQCVCVCVCNRERVCVCGVYVCVCGSSCWKWGQDETRAINVRGLDLIC